MTMDNNPDKELLEKKFLNVPEVARTLGVSKKTIYAMCKRNYLPGFKVGGRVLIDKNELEARIAELKQESTRKIVD